MRFNKWRSCWFPLVHHHAISTWLLDKFGRDSWSFSNFKSICKFWNWRHLLIYRFLHVHTDCWLRDRLYLWRHLLACYFYRFFGNSFRCFSNFGDLALVNNGFKFKYIRLLEIYLHRMYIEQCFIKFTFHKFFHNWINTLNIRLFGFIGSTAFFRSFRYCI